MNLDLEDRLDRPVFAQHRELAALERQLYGHVLAAIDFDALSRFEQVLYGLLVDERTGDIKVPHELAIDVAQQMIERAIERAAHDPARFCSTGPPFGITDAEKRAVAFQPDCTFCVTEAEYSTRAAHDHGDEPDCPLCEDLAEAWRDEHAEVLAKAGLRPARPGNRAHMKS